ncbi:MAG: fibronectin type III domain-containing protein, partial [Gammaproteobacteria bacterium]
MQTAPSDYLNEGAAAGKDVPGGEAERQFKISGLTDKTSYSMQVAAVNAAGPGAWSGQFAKTPLTAFSVCLGAAAITTIAACKIAAAAGYSVDGSVQSAQTFVVSVVRTDPGDAVTHTLESIDGENQIIGDADIVGALPFAGVQVTVAASALGGSTNVALTPKTGGDGGSAEVKLSFTDASIRTTIFTLSAPVAARIPGAPALSLRGRGNRLIASWTAPADTGSSAILGYKIRWAEAAAPRTYLNRALAAGDTVGGNEAARMHTISGLTDGVTYLVEVAAVNAGGAGAWAQAR